MRTAVVVVCVSGGLSDSPIHCASVRREASKQPVLPSPSEVDLARPAHLCGWVGGPGVCGRVELGVVSTVSKSRLIQVALDRFACNQSSKASRLASSSASALRFAPSPAPSSAWARNASIDPLILQHKGAPTRSSTPPTHPENHNGSPNIHHSTTDTGAPSSVPIDPSKPHAGVVIPHHPHHQHSHRIAPCHRSISSSSATTAGHGPPCGFPPS